MAKMADLAKKEITSGLVKISNEMAKGQFASDDFNEKGEFGENEMTKWPFESGDFDENGEIGVNDEYGRHSLKS